MILIVCAGDPKLVQLAHSQSRRDRSSFGSCYQAFSRFLPVLGMKEDLFILARAAFNETQRPMIGDDEDQLFVDAAELFEIVVPVFPQYFSGNIYVCAQVFGGMERSTLPFAASFSARLRLARRPMGTVYGSTAPIGITIPRPGHFTWRWAECERIIQTG